jgi:hypothetical protein
MKIVFTIVSDETVMLLNFKDLDIKETKTSDIELQFCLVYYQVQKYIDI